MQGTFETKSVPELRIPRVDEEIEFPVHDQVQIERLVPVEIHVARADHRARFVGSVALEHAVKIPHWFHAR